MTLLSPDRRILGIFAKQPIVGQAKTRLAETTSADWAQRVANALLVDSLARFERVEAKRAIVFAPADAAAFFSNLANGRYELLAQADGDLGQRLQNFFNQARARGFTRIIAIGTDSPTLPTEFIERAFRLLENHDVVIGPAFDGGYYLIGCGPLSVPVFIDIPWSTPRVLEETVKCLVAASARLAILPPWYDIDTTDDWAMLRGHLRAMRRAGIDPGVPRVEELMTEQVFV